MIDIDIDKREKMDGVVDALTDVAGSPAEGRSLWEDARRRLSRNKAAMACLFILAAVIAMAIVLPWMWPWGYEQIDKSAIEVAPTLKDWHWMGTDAQGRDVVIRLMYGLRVSLAVGLIATFVSMVIGVTVFAIALTDHLVHLIFEGNHRITSEIIELEKEGV